MKAQEKLNTGSAVFISLTSMLGAGIFIKVRSLNILAHNNVTPIVFLFIFFLLGMMAFSHVLMKIVPSQTGNMGFMEWSKHFCGRRLHEDFCRFVKNLYYPVSLFLFSTYGVLGITGEQLGVCATLGLAIFVILLLLFINFFSFKWAKRIQIFLSMLVLIPLFLLPFLGMISPGGADPVDDSVGETFWGKHEIGGGRATGLDGLGAWMILVSGLPSLLFIYDGFYSIASLKSRLKNSKKLPAVILASMGAVTLIYLNVIIGFNAGDPKFASLHNFRLLAGRSILIDTFDLLISCASFLTLNSIIMGCIPQIKAMHESKRMEDVESIRRYIFYRREHEDSNFEENFCVLLSVLWKTVVCFLIAGFLISVITYFDLSREPKDILHSLADIITIFIFIILLATVCGSYRKHPLVRESQLFRWCVKLCAGIILVALGYMIVSFFVGTTGYAGSNRFNSWMKIAILTCFTIITFCHRIYRWWGRLFRRDRYMIYRRERNKNIITLD